jgi:hypothetical protein
MLISWWWWVWLACMFVFLVTPMGYGWGYRGWGPPVPSYMQRLRTARGDPFGGRSPYNHTTWGYGGDLIWMFVFVLAFFAVGGFWWRW